MTWSEQITSLRRRVLASATPREVRAMTPADAAETDAAVRDVRRREAAYGFLWAGYAAAAALAPHTEKNKRPKPMDWVPTGLRDEFFPDRIRSAAELDAATRAAGFDPDTGKPLARA